eukprot:GHVS01004419.1.p2 GENE.GHVS01004419.1~~GHVS01004419.1.p2  ORF type:complete len:138 (-),score=44.71 GHVS01004419.1:554-967(-)
MTRPSDPFVEIPLPSAIREETSDNTRPAATTAGSPAGGGTAGGGGKKKSFLPRSVFGSVSSIFSSKPHIPNINRGAKTPPPPPPPPPPTSSPANADSTKPATITSASDSTNGTTTNATGKPTKAIGTSILSAFLSRG